MKDGVLAIAGPQSFNRKDRLLPAGARHQAARSVTAAAYGEVIGTEAAHPMAIHHAGQWWRLYRAELALAMRTSWRKRATARALSRSRRLTWEPNQHVRALD
jgi:hypothetical protein